LKAVAILKEAATRWIDDSCYRMGASLAFYAIFSLFPLMLVAVSVLGFVLGHDPATREKVVGLVAGTLSPESRALLEDTLASMQAHSTARGLSALVGAATLFFGASGVFSELETSLNTIWRGAPNPSAGLRVTILRAVVDKAIAFGAVVTAALILLASLLATTALSAVSRSALTVIPVPALWQGAEALVSFGITSFLFAIIFRVLPRANVTWRDVTWGALLSALLFSISKHLLAWYLGHLGSYAAYGAVGGVLGLLTWIDLVSFGFFLGAETTRVYAEQAGSLVRHEGARTAIA
jgi:membrane protein